jgi:hypothetical protein
VVFGGGGSVFRVFLAGENGGIVHPVCGVWAGEMGFGTCVRLIYMTTTTTSVRLCVCASVRLCVCASVRLNELPKQFL